MHSRRLPALLLAGLLLASAGAAHAQNAPQATSSAGVLVPGLVDDAVLGQLRFRSLGPAAMSGRVSDIAVAVPRDAGPGTRLGQVIYITTTGGAWKSVTGGKTWEPITDETPVHSAGAIAVAPTNPDIVWLGSGEANNLRSSSWGHGIYRSTDAGRTWTHMGLRESQHIARIVIHPTNTDIVYVAAMGPLWGAGGERGFYMTGDGGGTWTRTLAGGPHTGVTDIALDPSNPNTMYAATYQRDRRAHSFVAGGPESAIHKSTDGGRTWTRLTDGLPTGEMGRIGLAVAASRPTTIYATVDAQDGGVFRSDDGGATWRRQSTLQSIPWFFGQIRVDPTNAERVYHLGVALNASEDGGVTWRSIGNRTHADHHSMWIDPKDSNHMMIGNDGGFYISYDRGTTWDFATNLPVPTYYTVSVDNRWPHYWIYGGLQDNGTFAGPASLRTRTGAVNTDWRRIGGGDGFYVLADPQDTLTVYWESQNGNLSRRDMATDESKSIRPSAEPGERLRWNWSSPLVISPHAHRTIYFAANVLFRSDDRGDSWTRVSGDLTRNLNRETLEIMGRSAPGGYRRHEGTADFGNITTIDESPVRQGVLYVGTDDGLVQVSRDGGASWRRIESFPGVPDMTYVSRVIASRHHEGTVYATFDGHRSNDFRPYVMKSTDFGATWTAISSNLPPAASVQVIREHHRNPNLLFVGTEDAVHVTLDGGRSWAKLGAGMPGGVPVHDMMIQERANDLAVATHGRGLFVLDDLTPLEKLADAVAARSVVAVFAPRETHIWNPAGGPMTPGFRTFAAENLPPGAIINYYVAPTVAAGASAALVIRDAQGAVVRELPARVQAGVQRTRWDLRYQGAAAAAAAQQRAVTEEEEEQSPAGGGGPGAGPYVFPGEYTVELRLQPASGAATTSDRQRFTVVRDPLVRLTEAEYRMLHDARIRAWTLQRDALMLTAQLEEARARVDAALGGRADGAAGVQAARQLVTEMDDVLTTLRGRVAQGAGGGGGGGAAAAVTTRAAGVANALATSHFLPTPDQLATLQAAETEFRAAKTRGDAAVARTATVLQGLGVNP
jgi:photosystem II stability/assembly factor-like uncharacterized protein